MASAAYTLAVKYYPSRWDIERLKTLVKAGKLTEAEYQEITGESSSDSESEDLSEGLSQILS